MTSFKMSLRNTGWATRYLSHVWLSTNGVIHCESYNLQAGVKSPLTVAKRPVSGRNVQRAKRPGGETSRWRNVQGAKRQRGETSINRFTLWCGRLSWLPVIFYCTLNPHYASYILLLIISRELKLTVCLAHPFRAYQAIWTIAMAKRRPMSPSVCPSISQHFT